MSANNEWFYIRRWRENRKSLNKEESESYNKQPENKGEENVQGQTKQDSSMR